MGQAEPNLQDADARVTRNQGEARGSGPGLPREPHEGPSTTSSPVLREEPPPLTPSRPLGRRGSSPQRAPPQGEALAEGARVGGCRVQHPHRQSCAGRGSRLLQGPSKDEEVMVTHMQPVCLRFNSRASAQPLGASGLT